MNVFILCTGRCGSTTFAKACGHIANYSSAHESRFGLVGEDRLDYPEDHIEADNRLSWMLGPLAKLYGNEAFYVHLRRDNETTAASFERRWGTGIIEAYTSGVLVTSDRDHTRREVCLDYCRTVNANIEAFLTARSKKMEFSLETAKDDFIRFWDLIGARGNLDAALAEWDTHYNASEATVR